MFSNHPHSPDSYWIISQQQLFDLLDRHGQLEPFRKKIAALYKIAFPAYRSAIFSLFMPWTFAIYCKGHYKKTNNQPRIYELPRLIDSIVSILTLEQEEDRVSIWNACNDLSVKGGHMRSLFDAVLHYLHPGEHQLILYVALVNPYFEKAVQLYLEKGFRWVGMYNDMAIHMEYTNEPTQDTVSSIMSGVQKAGYSFPQ